MNLILIILCALITTILSGFIAVPILRRIKVGQPIYKYVKAHKEKYGTPTMGGLFFVLSAVLIYFIFCGFIGRLSIVAIAVGLAFLCVGFLDDFIKIKRKENEGLKPYQKIIFQIAIGAFVGIFCYVNNLTMFFIPFAESSVNLGIFTVPIVAIVMIAITNSVNLTDGLDGLASSVSIVYLIAIACIIVLQMNVTDMLTPREEYHDLICLTCALVGALLGFLLFNVNKASVFMGDTGSLALGGFIGAISIFSSNCFFIPIIGIMFVISSISVIVQVLHYKRTKSRILLMAPLHHHFQLKGYTETKITFCYSLITAVTGALCVIPYL